MLVEFRVKNFKSFQDEQTLSLVASADKSLPDNVFTAQALGDQKLVHSSVLYGANASGKSNLIAAINFFKEFVIQSAKDIPNSRIPVHPFRLNPQNRQAPSEFEVTFIHQEIRYQYGFSVDHQNVQEEWLIGYPKGRAQTWFERRINPDSGEYDWYFGPNLKGEKKLLQTLTKSNSLYLSVAATFKHEQLSTIYKWFQSQLYIIDLGEDYTLEIFAAKRVNEIKDEKFHLLIKNFLQLADLGIIDFSAEEKEMRDNELLAETIDNLGPISPKSMAYVDIQMKHQTSDPGDSSILFPIYDESLGTRRLFALSIPWIAALFGGCTLFVDELDTSLHPALVRALVEMFHLPDINLDNAQLIFNTHDVSLLDLSLFRRDQIWFVEKDRQGASHIYPLLEFNPRKGEALAKGYLQGRYGAIPFLREEKWQELKFNGEG